MPDVAGNHRCLAGRCTTSTLCAHIIAVSEGGAIVKLTEDELALLRRPSICYLATTMADGSPQVTQTWVDTDGKHVLINSVQSHVKIRNIARDPRVAVAVAERDDPSR